MKRMDCSLKKRIMIIFTVLSVVVMSAGSVTSVRAAGTYKVSFKAGAKGTIAGGQSYQIEGGVAYKDRVNVDLYQGLVEPEEGYYFTGWSPEAQGDVEITKKTTFVAQYARIIEKAVYRVNYVDTFGNAVSTQKVITANEGAKVTAYAEPVADYAVDAAVKTAEVNKDGTTEITFVYTSTLQPDVVTETETVILPGGTTVTVVGSSTQSGGTASTAPGTAQGTGSDAGTAGTADTTAEEGSETETGEGATVQEPDEEVPLDDMDEKETKKSEDEEVPLADAGTSSSDNWKYVMAAGIILLAVAGTVLVYRKRKKN